MPLLLRSCFVTVICNWLNCAQMMLLCVSLEAQCTCKHYTAPKPDQQWCQLTRKTVWMKQGKRSQPSCVQALPDEEDKDEEDTAGGVILAHSMGLGKSLQTVAFLHTFHAYWPGKRSLLLVPSNVLHNWVDEFQRWLPRGRDEGENELTPSKVCKYCSSTAGPALASALFVCNVSS